MRSARQEWIESSFSAGRTGPGHASDAGRPGTSARETVELDTSARCEDAAQQLECLFASAENSLRLAVDAVNKGILPRSESWEPVQELLDLHDALRSALAPGTHGSVAEQFPDRLPATLALLRERADRLSTGENLRARLGRITTSSEVRAIRPSKPCERRHGN